MKTLNDLPLVMDGATGTRLQKLGMPPGVCVEKWVLRNPGAIREVQTSYLDAGADLIFAPTFGANRISLRNHGITDPVRGLVADLVALTRETVADKALVVGDIAPTGLQVFPAGSTSFEELVDVFAELAQALDAAGVDIIGIETQMSLAEARAAVIGTRSVSQKPILVTFSCTDSGRTLFGGDLTAALLSLQDMGISAYGINCCGDLELVSRLLAQMKRYAKIPLIAKPNAGAPKTIKGRPVYSMSPARLAEYIPSFVGSGASIIGGCCGTDEGHIRAIRERLQDCQFVPGGPPDTAVCASERGVAELVTDTRVADLLLSEDIVEEAALAQAEGAEVLYVKVRDEKDLEILRDYQYAIHLPLCIECCDGDLLSRTLRIYNGKPVVV